jgi:hypothetical protein
MPTDEHLAKQNGQISRLEQVMTALAEAQVKGEDDTAERRRSMAALAKAQAKTEEAQAKTEAQMTELAGPMNVLATTVAKLSSETRASERQWLAYLSTLPKN